MMLGLMKIVARKKMLPLIHQKQVSLQHLEDLMRTSLKHGRELIFLKETTIMVLIFRFIVNEEFYEDPVASLESILEKYARSARRKVACCVINVEYIYV